MHSELQALLEAQAEWQRSRARLSWPEKIRMAEAMRESAAQLRRIPSDERRSPAPTSTAPSTVSEKARFKSELATLPALEGHMTNAELTELITPLEEIAMEEGFAKGQAEGLAKGRVEVGLKG